MTATRCRRRFRPALELLETRETPAFTALGFGGAGVDAARAVTTDAAGDIYVTGSFQGTVDFDPGSGVTNFTAAGVDDIFLAKYSVGGALIWARQMGGTGSDIGNDIAVDASGNVYITGSFTGSVDFDPGPGTTNLTSAGQDDIFVGKISATGSLIWAGHMGGTGPDKGNAIAVDSLGNVFTTGSFQGGSADFDPGPGIQTLPSSGWDEVFISKLDGNGNYIWKGKFTGASSEQGNAIALDIAGNIYVAGFFGQNADFDPALPTNFNLTSAGNADVFIAKLDNAGNFLWAVRLGGPTTDHALDIAVDGVGNVIASGYFGGTADFDPGAGTFNLVSAGNNDVFVCKLDSGGNFAWARAMGGPNLDVGLGIGLAAAGDIFIAGSFISTADFDPGAGTFPLTSLGSSDAFVCQLDSAGNFVSAGIWGAGNQDAANAIAVDASGRFFVAGSFSATADFAPGPGIVNLTSAGGTDIFLAQLPGVIVNDTAGSTSVTEGGATDTYTVVLDWLPSANVIVTLTPDSQLSLSATTLTFTTANWNVLQTVTITAIDDTSGESSHTGVITHTTTSADPRYNATSIPSLTAAVTDNDQTPLQLFQTVTLNGGHVAAGVGVNGGTSANLTVSGIPAGSTVTGAYLYWGFVDQTQAAGQPNLTFAGTPITGTFLGSQPFGGTSESYVYRATVTSLVAGNGTYALSGIASGAPTVCDGASLIVIYSNPILPTRTVVIYDGNNIVIPPFLSATNTFTGFTVPARFNVSTTFIVGDGGPALDENASLTGSQGTLNLNNSFTGSTGRYWDADTYNITPYVAAGDTSFSANITYAGDQLYWLAQVVSVGPPEVLLTESGGSTSIAESGATDTYTVSLANQPTANVVVTMNPDAQQTVSPATLTFTPANWSSGQTVTVTAASDSLVEGDHTGVIAHSASSGDPNYNGVLTGTLTTSIFDDDPNNMTVFQTLTINGDYTAAGTGLLGQTGGTITLTSIPAGSTVTAAYLFWGFYSNTQLPTLATLSLNGTPLTGTLTGSQPNNGGIIPPHTYAFRADVTTLVTGNGTYPLSGVANSGGAQAQGASIVAIFSNPAYPSRSILIYNGAGQLDPSRPTLLNTLTGFTAPSRINAHTTFIVGQGEGLGGTNTFTAGGGTTTFSGVFTGNDGNNWDTTTVNVSNALAPGDTSATDTFIYGGDYLLLVAQILSVGMPGITINPSGGSTDVAEAGPTSDTYTVNLQALPSANVIVTLNANTQLAIAPTILTFTPTNWLTPQTVTVTAVDDLVNEGIHTGVISSTVTSTDAGYNGLPLAALTATITDNDNVSITVTESGGSTLLTEGGATDTYTVVLTIQPIANVVVTLNTGTQVSSPTTRLTFTSANWSTPQTVTLTAVDDFLTEGPHSGTVNHNVTSADPRYNGFTTASITASITDNDTAGLNLVLSGGATNVTEGAATDTYTVVLNTSPSANVSITLTPGAQVNVSAPVLTFTSANWNVVQTVTVSAVDDAIFEGPHAGVVNHAVTSGDPSYNATPVPAVTANITDNDAVGVTQSGGSTDVSEAGLTDSYTLVLNSMPTANVILTITPPASLTAGPTTLTFTPAVWNVPQTVNVSALDDLVYQGPHTGVLQHTASSADPNYNAVLTPSVTANIADNDVAGVTVTPLSLALAEGGPGSSYGVVLTSQPAADVVLALTGASLTLSAAALTFTPANWNNAQNVTVTALDDVLAQGLHNGTVAHSASSSDPGYNAIGIATLTASITDDDVPGITLSSSSITVLEGSTRTYTAVLDLPPVADVVLNFAPGSLLALATPALTFTAANWNVPQAVVVTALDDALVQGNHAATISHGVTSADPAYNGLAVQALTANIIDNEGTVILGTPNPDKIIVTSSTDLTTVRVSVNGKTSTYSSAAAQLLITTFGGADSIQIYNPIVPIVIVGGLSSDAVLIAGLATTNAFTVGDSYLTANSTTVNLFEVENVVAAGANADDTFTVAGTPLYNVECRGNLGNDQILGDDRPNTWQILNPNYGTLNANLKFTSVENLTGGSSTDGFYFRPGKSISGLLDGGAGSNMLNYALCTSAIAVNLQTGKATGVPSFQNIDQVVGGKNTADRLVGLDQANTWTITDWNTGNVNGVSFASIENLVGGGLDDTFRLADNRGLKGKIDGAGGNDALDYSSYLSKAVALLLQTHVATNLGGFNNVEQFTGGAAKDTLIGASLNNAWNLTGSNTGDVNGLTFAGFENLTGGIKNDTFNLNIGAAWTGLLDGGVGLDSLLSTGGTYVLTGPSAGSLNGRTFKNVERRS